MYPRISELIIIDFCDDFRTENSHPGFNKLTDKLTTLLNISLEVKDKKAHALYSDQASCQSKLQKYS